MWWDESTKSALSLAVQATVFVRLSIMRSCQCWILAVVLLSSGNTTAFNFLNQQRRLQLPVAEMNCFEVPMKMMAVAPARMLSPEGWRMARQLRLGSAFVTSFPRDIPATTPTPIHNRIQKRYDHLFTENEDIIKEHAKLVQDINSLRQLVFVSPYIDEPRDYEDTIYHDIVVTSTTTARPKTTTTIRPTKTSKQPGIPLILLGGASSRQSVKAQPAALKLPKPSSISLVGSSITPLVKHPYPFVGQASSQRPFKICMSPIPMLYTSTTRRPTLWNRLLSFLPKLTGR